MIKEISIEHLGNISFYRLNATIKDYLIVEDLEALRIQEAVNDEYLPAFDNYVKTLGTVLGSDRLKAKRVMTAYIF